MPSQSGAHYAHLGVRNSLRHCSISLSCLSRYPASGLPWTEAVAAAFMSMLGNRMVRAPLRTPKSEARPSCSNHANPQSSSTWHDPTLADPHPEIDWKEVLVIRLHSFRPSVFVAIAPSPTTLRGVACIGFPRRDAAPRSARVMLCMIPSVIRLGRHTCDPIVTGASS